MLTVLAIKLINTPVIPTVDYLVKDLRLSTVKNILPKKDLICSIIAHRAKCMAIFRLTIIHSLYSMPHALCEFTKVLFMLWFYNII